MNNDLIYKDNQEYWVNRAEGYSRINQDELSGVQRHKWSRFLDGEIRKHFDITSKERDKIRILDIGAGPGFISIILTRLGYVVTAADFADSMLDELRKNAYNEGARIDVKKENAMALTFANDSFDMIISRNLTWNLPEPKTAYKEWLRVLKDDGLMLVFDANWYGYLRDEDKLRDYQIDRENVKNQGLYDYNIGDNFHKMEQIANNMPLTGINRPSWDKKCFNEMSVSVVTSFEDIGSKVYSEKEKVNFNSTPMFMVKVVK